MEQIHATETPQENYNTVSWELFAQTQAARIEALEQHLSDMRLIVFGHYLKKEEVD